MCVGRHPANWILTQTRHLTTCTHMLLCPAGPLQSLAAAAQTQHQAVSPKAGLRAHKLESVLLEVLTSSGARIRWVGIVIHQRSGQVPTRLRGLRTFAWHQLLFRKSDVSDILHCASRKYISKILAFRFSPEYLRREPRTGTGSRRCTASRRTLLLSDLQTQPAVAPH